MKNRNDMNIKEKWQISLIIFAVLFFAYEEFIEDPLTEKKNKEYYSQFNSADIHGVFSKAVGKDRALSIIVDGTEYVIRPYSATDGRSTFNKVVSKGDSIIKRKYDNILIVKKPDGTEYRYKFDKYE